MTRIKHWKQTIAVIAIVGVLGFIIFYLYCGIDTLACFQIPAIEPVNGETWQNESVESPAEPDLSVQYQLKSPQSPQNCGEAGMLIQQDSACLTAPLLRICASRLAHIWYRM